ncbi:bifunctional riboflavin kinase/FAD synthetase [Xenorhabdus bovienii]|uniref:Riboflavin biosynthesis protein n=1 Tax=Xenorhabdus bovienii str. Intermedium TaxID=1379677 RepID=A0A077QDY8_XENBV|nr:bifunctional riboflavin kinase/FAD synthetase [Xenorhabdus bovienii]MDE1482385.1 bifunctional riboflavin kinase/FAD synthetase [Xenorhabdus bovienii]MDE9432513.1 bifunctional riboflavin kinase/FAD synthetase [Xenorhabdus bovienii]MDE9435821.1 bifunctional riboflavin kinase/FAD synthetase [Xenorhabdus bovienii]MDE9441671.1 bifunctional riboflavin kinase/FAD synthetase [Xenorhabdus bovienii]MDE9452367.1 bifunctional riboflavin kinase/FAD synthetase [Xenorhabdus bovienii]
MELIRGVHNIRARHHGCVLTIGNFDGVHRGHQALLKHLKQEGLRSGLPTIVMIFEPQPLEVFAADKAPARLTRLRDKIRYLSQYGVDYLLCVKFDRNFAANSPEAFVSRLLVEKLGVKFLAIGDDFRFGKNRLGDFHYLQQAGKQYGFDVASTDSFCDSGLRISSTAIRQALQDDDLALAETLLGHPYSISGRVVHGNRLGRTIGFPTANLPLKRLVAPVKGVYAVEVYGLGDKPLPGVANIGNRPTVSGLGQQLEVHLIDTQMDLYGRHIDVVLRKKLRDEQRFASLDALKQQIANDVVAARDYLLQRSESCI